MRARKYLTDADRPVFVPTRMPRVVIDYLHLLVRIRHPACAFDSLQALQADILDRFLAAAPTATGFAWRTPRVADRRDDQLSYCQINFQLSRAAAHQVDHACAQAGVTRAVLLYTATMYYIRHIAAPDMLGLAP